MKAGLTPYFKEHRKYNINVNPRTEQMTNVCVNHLPLQFNNQKHGMCDNSIVVGFTTDVIKETNNYYTLNVNALH